MQTALERLFDRYRRRGDTRALARIFDRTAPGLLELASHLTDQPAEAEDLLQATFVTAIERAERFDAGRSLLAWLMGILAHHARNARRRRRPLAMDDADDGASDPPSTEREVVDKVALDELAVKLRDVIEELREPYRTVLLGSLSGDGVAEIALSTDRSPATVRKQLARSLELLRRRVPASMAGGVPLLKLDGARGIEAVRAAVIDQAAQHAVVASGGAVGGVTGVALGLAALMMSVVLMVTWTDGGGETELSGEVAIVAAPGEVQATRSAGPDLAHPEEALVRTEIVPTAASVLEGSFASSNATPRGGINPSREGLRLRARVELPNGLHATGARFKLSVKRDKSRVVIEEGSVGPEGLLSIGVPPGSTSLALDVHRSGYARAEWRSSEFVESQDIGTLRLGKAGRVVVRIVDDSGEPVQAAWEVTVRRENRTMSGFKELPDHSWLLPDVPVGMVEVRAESPLNKALARKARVQEGQEVHVELAFAGPLPGGRLRVQLHPTPRVAPLDYDSLEGSLTLVPPSGEELPMTAAPFRSMGSDFEFEGLAEGPHVLDFQDPRFESVRLGGVEAGQAVTVQFRGNAAVRFELLEQGGVREDFRLIAWVESMLVLGPERSLVADVRRHWNTGLNLKEPQEPVPADGVYSGLAPGSYHLTLEVDGRVGHASVSDLQPNETRKVSFDFDRSSVIEGRVLDLAGHPVEGIDVMLLFPAMHDDSPMSRISRLANRNTSGTNMREELTGTRTDADGRFRMVPTAVAGILRAQRAYASGAEIPWPTEGEIELILPDSTRINGRVLKMPPAEDAQGLNVMTIWESMSKSDRMQADILCSTPLAADGTFLIENPPPGVVEIYLMRGSFFDLKAYQGELPEDLLLAEVLVEVGEQVVVEIPELPITFGRATLSVVLDGEPAAGMPWLLIRDSIKDGSFRYGMLDEDGRVTATGVLVGDWRLVLGVDRGGHTHNADWIGISDDTLSIVVDTVPEASFSFTRIAGSLTCHLGGEALRDAIVLLAPKMPIDVPSWTIRSRLLQLHLRTDGEGRIEVRLPAGTYTLKRKGPGSEGSQPERVEFEWTVAGSSPPILDL